MSTIARNNIVRQVAPNTVFADLTNVVSSACTWNQGDLLFFDGALGLVKPVASDANAVNFIGVAVQSVVAGKPAAVYSGTKVDAAVSIQSLAGPVFGVEAKLKLKNGDTFSPGAPVYATAVDAQTVSSAGTNVIGIYVGPTVTAGAATEGVCRLGSRYYAGTIQV